MVVLGWLAENSTCLAVPDKLWTVRHIVGTIARAVQEDREGQRAAAIGSMP